MLQECRFLIYDCRGMATNSKREELFDFDFEIFQEQLLDI